MRYKLTNTTMQRTLLLVSILIINSCTTQKELIKSDSLSQNCYCSGTGDYAIVMEAGMGNWSLLYQPLFQKLIQNHKVCLIDRAGYAMDTVTRAPRTLQIIASELNSALSKQGITNNIIGINKSSSKLVIP